MSDSFLHRYGPWALIAGASEGLGEAFARELAGRGLNLILLARRGDVLETLAAELRQHHGVQVQTSALDLARADLAAAVRTSIGEREVGLLVYNAAFSKIGDFVTQSLDDKLRMLDVNCRGPLILAHELGQPMRQRGRGGIILMTSMAGAQGAPLIATYGATKAFNLVLAEGLWDELRGHGVDVIGCRAGSTRTPGYLRSKPEQDVMLMAPEPVVKEALAALGKGPSVVPGLGNRLATLFMGHLFPRRLAVQILGSATRRMYPQK